MDANNRIRKLTLAISQNRFLLFLPSYDATLFASLLSYLFQMRTLLLFYRAYAGLLRTPAHSLFP